MAADKLPAGTFFDLRSPMGVIGDESPWKLAGMKSAEHAVGTSSKDLSLAYCSADAQTQYKCDPLFAQLNASKLDSHSF